MVPYKYCILSSSSLVVVQPCLQRINRKRDLTLFNLQEFKKKVYFHTKLNHLPIRGQWFFLMYRKIYLDLPETTHTRDGLIVDGNLRSITW